MFPSEYLIQKQECRRSKVRTITEGIQNMENLIADQQIRIQELENFILWIYQVSAEGKTNNTNITNAIENFQSGTSVSSVTKKSEYVSDVPHDSFQRNLTFFPISAASSLSKQQTFSVQSVPMHESKIRQIQFSQAGNHTIKLAQFQKPTNMIKTGVLKPYNRQSNSITQTK